MTRDRSVPKRYPPKQAHASELRPRVRQVQDSTVRPSLTSPANDLPQSPQPPLQTGRRSQPGMPTRRVIRRSHLPKPEPERTVVESEAAAIPAKRRLAWLLNWNVALALTATVTLGSGVLAAAYLFQLPGLPNCPAVFWPLAPASLRFECARIAASKQTAKDLLEAITLVDGLPSNHSLREEADRLVELWSQQVLDLAEESFHQGQLKEAIASARRIPRKSSAHKLVENRIKQWESIWDEAEAIYSRVEANLRKRNTRNALDIAVQLLEVGNRHWQTTKYNELSGKITQTREDITKLGDIERLIGWGGLENAVEALKLAEQIQPSSYVFSAVQEAIVKVSKRMMALAQERLDAKDFKGAIAVLEKIPAKANLEKEVRDFTVLANAESQAWSGSIPGLEEAIAQAQRVSKDRPLYKRAQQLIARWQLEIEGVAQLQRAKVLAQSGSVSDLSAAIATASSLTQSNPRWRDAQQQMQQWQDNIETQEDRPVLDRAEQLAIPGDVASLQAAIAQASQISSNRALHSEAQRRIRQWTEAIERFQDQPILDQARAYASAGDLPSAIKTARQVQAGRVLHSDAQNDIKEWERRVAAATAQQALQAAYQAANAGTPAGLSTAIQLASDVSGNEADAAISQWSRQLLDFARRQATTDMAGAIALAQQIPSRSQLYSEAQALIKSLSQPAPSPQP